MEHRDLHQRGQPDRAAGVVREDEEARPERPQLREREAVRDRRRGELAHAEMEVPAGAIVGGEVARAVERQPRLRRRSQIGGAADEPGHGLRDGVQHLARGVTARDALRVGVVPGDARVPAVRERPPLHAARSRRRARERGPVLLEQRLPVRRASRPRAPMPSAKCSTTPSGTRKSGVLGPAVEPFRRLHAVRPERLAVCLRRVLDRRAVPDVAVHDDQGRALVLGAERLERPTCRFEVVRVRDRLDVPAVRGEARRHVLREGEIRVPLDRHAVRVVDPAQVREALVCGERRRLRRDTLHHAAVAGLRVHVEVEEREARPGCSARRATGSRSPFRRTSRRPVPAGRWSSRRRSSTGTRDGPGHFEPSWRKRLRSSSETAGSPRIS